MAEKSRMTVQIDAELSLVPYYPCEETTLAWYQDKQLCKQVDCCEDLYDPEKLRRMYDYLNSHGELFYIQDRGILCGDVCLQASGELSIVVCREYQNRHIGRRVITAMLELAKQKGLTECFAEVYSFNTQSQRMLETVGFVRTGEERYVYAFQGSAD